jgi:soluble lytic murein transglycosylase-like protein
VVRTGTWRTTARPRIAHRPRSSSKGFALEQVVQRAWPLREFQCLDALWTRESGWNHRAHNPSSGAYGIPQALPGGKMRGAGPDWRHNPETQIRWGLAYIKGRYGRPCGAWGHFKSHNWY